MNAQLALAACQLCACFIYLFIYLLNVVLKEVFGICNSVIR